MWFLMISFEEDGSHVIPDDTFCPQLLLEKVGHVLSQQAQTETGREETEDAPNHGSCHGSPFSARAALQQTQAILSSTQRHTRAVLSSVTDTAWWKRAVESLKHPMRLEEMGRQDAEASSGFIKQGCHPFYEDVMEDCYLDVVSDLLFSNQSKIRGGHNFGLKAPYIAKKQALKT